MMAAHNHPASIRERGLADGCPRCEEHAKEPFEGLDDENLNNLLARELGELTPRSKNEAYAMSEVRKAIHMARRIQRCEVGIA